MKKLICVLLLLCCCLPACAENTFTYQNGIQFGMTLEEVKNLEDARNAVRYTREHADELNVDPDKIAVLGFSAGAHLAGMVSNK
mgnify:CR=1 FL=1